jgi:hypothetical protein
VSAPTPAPATPNPNTPTSPPDKPRFSRGVKLGAAAVTAIAALLGSIAAFGGHDEPPAPQTNGNQSNVGGDGCTATGQNSQCSVEVKRVLDDETLTDPDFRKELAKVSTAAPPAVGPYQFVVVETGKIGLKVRSGPGAKDEQIGSTGNRSIVWAECQQTSDFNADPSMNIGPIWVKIHWPATTGTGFANSQPKDPANGWVFRGYLVAAGHNGNIPAC